MRQAATLRSRKLAVAIPRAVFRQRVSDAPNYHRRFEPCDGWRDESAARRRGRNRIRATVSFPADSARGGRAGSRPRAVTRVIRFSPEAVQIRVHGDTDTSLPPEGVTANKALRYRAVADLHRDRSSPGAVG